MHHHIGSVWKMSLLRSYIVLAVFPVTFVYAESPLFQEGSLSIDTQCTRTCSLDDANLDTCWKQSTEYYTERLAQAISNYAGTIIWIHRWRQRHSTSASDEQFEKNLLDSFMKTYTEAFKDEDSDGFRIDPNVTRKIYEQIQNVTASLYQSHYSDEAEVLPNFACPTPCNYDSVMWSVLFFVMLAIFLLSLVSFVAYLYTHRQHVSSWTAADTKLIT